MGHLAQILVVLVATACSREPVEVRDPTPPPPPSVLASVAPPPVVSAVPDAPSADPKLLARFAHGANLGWVHDGGRDVALTLTRTFLDSGAATPDPAAVALAAAVRETSVVTGSSTGCAQQWKDVHLVASSITTAHLAAHAFVLRVGGAAKPSRWSNGRYAGERVARKGSPVPWNDGGLFGVLLHGDELILIAGVEFATGDADCPSLDETWSMSLSRSP